MSAVFEAAFAMFPVESVTIGTIVVLFI